MTRDIGVTEAQRGRITHSNSPKIQYISAVGVRVWMCCIHPNVAGNRRKGGEGVFVQV